MPHFVFVLGGGYSGLGKGIAAASISRLLKTRGFSVKPIKIDPYFNLGAGDQNPNEHGEVFVTEDGGEIDQDFGHYERITGQPCSKDQNITSGKIFTQVLDKSKNGKYLGKTVQLIPHVRNEVKNKIKDVAGTADIAVVEVGGTIGDDESLIVIRAISSMLYEDNEKGTVVVLAPLIFNEAVGEAKTKIIQNSISRLNELGIRADFLIVRLSNLELLDEKRKEKLKIFCNISKSSIIADPDTSSIYELPIVFESQGFTDKIIARLGLQAKKPNWELYVRFVKHVTKTTRKIRIAYVGKYVSEGEGVHKDAYVSVEEAITRALLEYGYLPEIIRVDAAACEKGIPKELKEVAGVIVPGGYGCRGLEGKINVIKFCRENKVPFLGLCLGLQMAVVEFARNVCSLQRAHTDEFDEEIPCDGGEHMVSILPEQEELRKSQGFIGTQRLGDFACVIKSKKIRKMYEKVGRPDAYEEQKLKNLEKFRLGTTVPEDFLILERHRHRREVNPAYLKTLEDAGMNFAGIHRSADGTILAEIIELPEHPFFVATQAHPEFTSTYLKPNPLFYGFAEAAIRFNLNKSFIAVEEVLKANFGLKRTETLNVDE